MLVVVRQHADRVPGVLAQPGEHQCVPDGPGRRVLLPPHLAVQVNHAGRDTPAGLELDPVAALPVEELLLPPRLDLEGAVLVAVLHEGDATGPRSLDPVTLDADLVARIDRADAVYGAGTPTPPAVLPAALAPLGLRADADHADFVARWVGCFVGVPVHAWHNATIGRETCVELTERARRDFGEVIDGLVIADDGSGNPIWIAANGVVRLLDHDRGAEVIALAPSFGAWVAENLTTERRSVHPARPPAASPNSRK